MIIYSPVDGDAITSTVQSKPRKCFLMTRLGNPKPLEVTLMDKAVKKCCRAAGLSVIDANSTVSGRDFLLKIWKLIASTPLSVGIVHEDIPASTQANIFYELGVAQALGKETVIVKSEKAEVPSDFIRTEHIVFDKGFEKTFAKYLGGLLEQADHYELIAEQLDRNPILAIDYLKRAYLITGDTRLKKKAGVFLKEAEVEKRAKNSVELLAAAF
jgi:hypothetical protein